MCSAHKIYFDWTYENCWKMNSFLFLDERAIIFVCLELVLTTENIELKWLLPYATSLADLICQIMEQIKVVSWQTYQC